MNENGEDSIAEDSGDEVIEGPWGYACVSSGRVFIPAVQATPEWPLRRVLAHLHQLARAKAFIFSAVLNADGLKSHLRNITREWDEWFEEVGEFSHCIEIAYEPAPAVVAVGEASE